MIVNIVIGVLVIAAAICFVDEAIEMWRAPDALTRVNLTGPVAGVGLPLLIIANLIKSLADGDVWYVITLKSIIAIAGLLIVSSVGSFVMGRAIHAEQLRRASGASLEKTAEARGVSVEEVKRSGAGDATAKEAERD